MQAFARLHTPGAELIDANAPKLLHFISNLSYLLFSDKINCDDF